MAESFDTPERPTDPVGRVLFKVSVFLAVLGGIMLSVIAIAMTVSITGRFIASAPIPGDYEMIAIGTGLAVCAFLPYCQLTRGNVLVDFFMVRAPGRAKAFCDVIGNVLYLVIAALLTWRMYYGALDMYNYSEKSITINFPRWTTFPISILFFSVLVIVTAYTLVRSLNELRTGRHHDQVGHG